MSEIVAGNFVRNRKPTLIDSFGYGKFNVRKINEAIRNDRGEILTGMIVEGVLQRADSINQNGRKYPYRILFREATRYKNTFINEKRSYGELDHPDRSVVSMQTASHWIQDIWWEGKDLCGRVELLDTPCGRIVESILRRGLTIGISSRGYGSVKALYGDEDTVEVQDDFGILAWDFVSNPSTQGAFLRPVRKEQIHEGVTYKQNENGLYVPEYKFARVNSLITDIIIGINE
jgi:hypothetical protein